MKRDGKLTEHFTLQEFMEGAGLSVAAFSNNWKTLTYNLEQEAVKTCEVLEKIRKDINKMAGVECGLLITSGYRSLEWEKMRGRSGKSQHTLCRAADWQVVSKHLSFNSRVALMEQWYKANYGTWQGGLSIKKSKGQSMGFVHIDTCEIPPKRRWVYG